MMKVRKIMWLTKNIFNILFGCLLLFMLTSCGTAFDVHPVEPITIATLQSYPTPISVFDYPGQVTDGELLLSIEEIDKICHKSSDPIKIKLIFENLLDKPINIPDSFFIAENRRGDGGNIIPLITTVDGQIVKTLADFQLVDIFDTPTDVYRQVPSKRSIDLVIEFRFPKNLAETMSDGTLDLATPNPGQYFIRFVYHSNHPNKDIWSGIIGSPQIQICITN